MSIEFLKSSSIFLGSHKAKHMDRSVFLPRKDLRHPKFSSWPVTEVLFKQEIKTKAELLSDWLNVEGVA